MKRRIQMPKYNPESPKIGIPAALALKMMRKIGVGDMINDALV